MSYEDNDAAGGWGGYDSPGYSKSQDNSGYSSYGDSGKDNNLFAGVKVQSTPIKNGRAVKKLDLVKQAVYQANIPFNVTVKTPRGKIPIGNLIGMASGPIQLGVNAMAVIGALIGGEPVSEAEFNKMLADKNKDSDSNLLVALAGGVQNKSLTQEQAQSIFDTNSQKALAAEEKAQDVKDQKYRAELAKARAGASGLRFGGTVNDYLSDLANARIDGMTEGFWGNN